MHEYDPKYHNTSDSKIWMEFINDDERAFLVIYKKNINRLFNYGLNFSRDEDLIKDCIHDVFVDLHKYRKNLSKNTNVNIQLYLFKSFKNAILKSLAKQKRQIDIDESDISFLFEGSVEDTLIKNEMEKNRVSKVKKAISYLSPKQKEAIFLKFNSGLTYEEIGEILQINYQSARNLIHRSIEKLRESCKNGVIILFHFIGFQKDSNIKDDGHNNKTSFSI